MYRNFKEMHIFWRSRFAKDQDVKTPLHCNVNLVLSTKPTAAKAVHATTQARGRVGQRVFGQRVLGQRLLLLGLRVGRICQRAGSGGEWVLAERQGEFSRGLVCSGWHFFWSRRRLERSSCAPSLRSGRQGWGRTEATPTSSTRMASPSKLHQNWKTGDCNKNLSISVSHMFNQRFENMAITEPTPPKGAPKKYQVKRFKVKITICCYACEQTQSAILICVYF